MKNRARSCGLSAVALALLAGSAGAGGCAFSDGDPWGRLELDAAARLDRPADRAVDGKLLTAENYLVALDTVELVPGDVTVAQKAEGSAGAFDPADPPEGYTLCHNGHCHATDGRLVPYEEVAAELAGGGGSAGPSVTIPVAAGAMVALPTSGEAAEIPLGDCPAGCEWARGEMDTVSVAVTSLHLRGTVFDQLTGGAARLPSEGVGFDVTIPLDAVAPSASLHAAFGVDEPVGLRVHATVVVPATLFDGIDFATADTAGSAFVAALAAAFGERAALALETSRFD
ncbi:MAG: hypothetical protein KC635_08330 [Myxococcales bacterium]|nr:hypothetical protein [Myxococcales bacterium]